MSREQQQPPQNTELSTTELVRENISRTPSADHKRGRVVGASLLCFSVDPRWGRLYFLLGKERKNTRWPSGSERWSDFGGRTANRGEEPEETAAREFFEESMAMVRYFDDDPVPRPGYTDIADSLRRGEFMFQFMLGFGNELKPRSYITFVKQIPWDPQAIQRFSQCREMLMNASSHYGGDRWKNMLSSHPGIREITTTTHTSSLSAGRSRSTTCLAGTQSEQQPLQALRPLQHQPQEGRVIQVRKDFLEKKSIALWSVPQLRHAVEFEGVISCRNGRVERCRPMFTEFLELLLSELNFYDPETTQELVL